MNKAAAANTASDNRIPFTVASRVLYMCSIDR
jgi:hypothetical protein